MANGYEVIVKIVADAKKAVSEFDKTSKAAERMAKRTSDETQKAKVNLDKLGKQAIITGGAMTAAGVTMAYALSGFVKSAQESERAQMQLQNTIKGSKNLAPDSIKAFNEQAKAIQNVTVASDEAVNGIQSMLGQFGLTKSQVLTLTPLVVDISRKMGIDFETAAKQVGKAVEGSTGGLKRMGVMVDQTKAKLDPFAATVEALRRSAGGFAQQEGQTFAGQMAILNNHADELKESLGRGVLSILNDILPAINNAAEAFNGLDEATGNTVGRTLALTSGLLILFGGMATAAGTIYKIKTAYDEAAVSSTRFAVAQKAIGYGFAAIAGYVVGSSIVDGVTKWGDKVDEGVRAALNADTAKEAFTDFERAATAQSSRESGGFINLGKGIGASIVQGVSLGSVRLYENLDNKWKRAAFDKTFKKVFTQDPEAARSILGYINADDKRHAAFVRMGVDLKGYQKMVKGALIDTNHDGVQSFEEIAAAQQEQAKAASDLISTVNGQAAAARDFAKATRGVEDAQKALTDAQDKYNEAVKSGDPAKIAEAAGVLQSAMLTLADAQDQARDAAYKHAEMLMALKTKAGDKESFDAAISQLKQMRDILSDPAEKKAIEDRIDALVKLGIQAGTPLNLNDKSIQEALWRLKASGAITEEQLKALTGGPKGWQLTVNTKPAADALRSFASEYKIPITEIAPNVRWEIANARAGGGPVGAGVPYLVGERGPELFVPTANGTIVPNGQMGVRSGTASVASTVTINVNASPLASPADTGAALLQALKAYERRNGALPLKVA